MQFRLAQESCRRSRICRRSVQIFLAGGRTGPRGFDAFLWCRVVASLNSVALACLTCCVQLAAMLHSLELGPGALDRRCVLDDLQSLSRRRVVQTWTPHQSSFQRSRLLATRRVSTLGGSANQADPPLRQQVNQHRCTRRGVVNPSKVLETARSAHRFRSSRTHRALRTCLSVGFVALVSCLDLL